MCLGIAGEVVALMGGDLASVRVEGVERPVNVGMLDDGEAVPGRWVLVHLGFAMSVIDRDEAVASLDFVTGNADWDPAPR